MLFLSENSCFIPYHLSRSFLKKGGQNEHQLGTKPKEIDVLIIKKNAQDKIHKNIGRIFKGHNIVEYKSPDDYLSIDDFYKVYGYACFYKSDATRSNAIQASDITITLVCHKYPRELMKHLKTEKNFIITQYDSGIYHIEGDTFMMQLIITPKLSEETNLWLHNLTNNIKDTETVKKLVREYGKHQNEGLYKSVMNIIVRANPKKFEEVNEMCEALLEIMADKINEKEHEYSCAAEPPIQCRVSHLSRRLEPLIIKNAYASLLA